MATTTDSGDTPQDSGTPSSESLPLLYHQSSQFRHWRFSHAQLLDIRETANAAAVERVKTNYEQELV
jgi:cyclin H